MSTCERCGATFHCAMADMEANPAAPADPAPCWCTLLPPAVPVPGQEGAAGASAAVGCWCPDCLKAHIAAMARQRG